MLKKYPRFLLNIVIFWLNLREVSPSSAGNNSWTKIGPEGPPLVYSLTIDPLTPTSLYAFTGTGLMKSTDSGRTWIVINTDLPDFLVIDPMTPNTLYAGYHNSGGGVSKSTDGGISWTLANYGLDNLDVISLVIDPSTPSTLYAGTGASGSGKTFIPGVVFKSI